MSELLDALLTQLGQGGLLALVALAAATLLSEDLACVAAGAAVAAGTLGFVPAASACFVGIVIGDLLLFAAGRLGRSWLHRPFVRAWLPTEALERAGRWFHRRGPVLIVASRFMPGTRLPVYVAAGAFNLPVGRVVTWFIIACAVWTPLLVGAAAFLGNTARHSALGGSSPLVVVLAALAGCVAVHLLASACTWRGRRLLLSRWRRFSRWEFWPMWALYAPVAVYALWLGLRHRGLTLPTAVNPGMGHGSGLVGESKSEILRNLSAAGPAIARWTLIPPGSPEQRKSQALDFMAAEHLDFPLVIKPDVGQRGAGVSIVRTADALDAALKEPPDAVIAQAYVPGVEFGVFYVRFPSEPAGRIFAITDKRMVTVRGDGRSTLERLILADDRAVCLAPMFLRKFLARLDEIPAEDEVVALSELGTHCRGALFLDGRELLTPALHQQIEEIGRTFEGFYFGRYDVRAESAEAFQRGEFKVIELNGLTSEATSIYDPKHSLWHGWRTLCRQWQLAFAIAAENRARGARPLTCRETLSLVLSRRPSPPVSRRSEAGAPASVAVRS